MSYQSPGDPNILQLLSTNFSCERSIRSIKDVLSCNLNVFLALRLPFFSVQEFERWDEVKGGRRDDDFYYSISTDRRLD